MWRDVALSIENGLEKLLFASRWLLAPFYLGLALSIVVLLIKFIGEFAHLAFIAFSAKDSDVILGVLTLVDLALMGSLLVIVIFSGYENFVSKIDHSGHKDWPDWMGTIDFSGLKLKLMSSIVAISGVQLLKQFMAISVVSPDDERTLFWLVVIHITFVVSSVLLALSDRIAGGHGGLVAAGVGGYGAPGFVVADTGTPAADPPPAHSPSGSSKGDAGH